MTDNPFIGDLPFSGQVPVTKSPELLKAGGKLRRAASIARFNGVTMAAFAVVSGLWAAGSAAFGAMDWVSTIMAGGLGVLAFGELKADGCCSTAIVGHRLFWAGTRLGLCS